MGIHMRELKITLTSQILNLISEIDEFRGQWSVLKNLSPERLKALRTVATIESIGSSTRIEGAKLSDRQVEELLGAIGTRSFRSRDEEEVAGYAEAMNVVFGSFGEIPLTENYIKQLHGILLRFSTKDIHHRGEYKKVPNSVEAFDAQGQSVGVIFQTASPFDTPRLMKELTEWTNKKIEEKTHHPLLLIAVFVLHFLNIHPFQDGNGRLSRVLTALLLLQKGYSYVPYSSLEHVVEGNKDDYYLSLRRSQKNLGTEEEDLEPWIVFFLKALKTQKDSLKTKIEREGQMLSLPTLSQAILNLAKEHGRITNSAVQAVTQANRNTIKAHFIRLVADGLLIQSGKGKGTWYRLG